MPLYEPNTRFSDCWSSVGDITFFHRDGKCFWKTKPVCVFPGTAGQLDQGDLHRRALAAWRTVEHSDQEVWNDYAKSVTSHRPPFDSSSHITGHNLFVSAYHGFAQLGDEHIPVPTKFQEFPVFVAKYSGVEEFSPDSGIIKFRVEMPDCQETTIYRLLTKLQFTEPGKGRRPGYLRNFIASENCTSSDCIVKIQVGNFRQQWEIEGESFQVHCRYLLLDSRTGYRSQYKSISFLIEL